MGIENINKEILTFQDSVKNLSTQIGSVSYLWKDKQFEELSNAIAEIAKSSKDVIVSGEQCCLMFKKFNKIASEKY